MKTGDLVTAYGNGYYLYEKVDGKNLNTIRFLPADVGIILETGDKRYKVMIPAGIGWVNHLWVKAVE